MNINNETISLSKHTAAYSHPVQSSERNGRKWQVGTFEKIKTFIVHIFQQIGQFFSQAAQRLKQMICSKPSAPDLSKVFEKNVGEAEAMTPDRGHLDFSSDETQLILNTAQELRTYPSIQQLPHHASIKRIDPSLHNWIFEMHNMEGIIFKMSREEGKLKERLETIQSAREICEQNNLSFLKIPEPKVLLKDNLYAEKKYRLLENSEEIKKVYTGETLEKIFTQLALFICKSGTSDLTHQNLGFLADGSGVCLYDLEDLSPENPAVGLKSFVVGCTGGSLGSTFFEQIREVIRMHAPDAYKKLYGNS